jgi:hypothetical protein
MDLGSLVKDFAEFVDVGNDGDADYFRTIFCDFEEAGLDVVFKACKDSMQLVGRLAVMDGPLISTRLIAQF